MDNKTLNGLRDELVNMLLDIDSNISKMIDARMAKDKKTELDCLNINERLVLGCEHILSLMKDVIDDCYIIPKPTPRISDDAKSDKSVTANEYKICVQPLDDI